MERDRKTKKSGRAVCCLPMRVCRISGLKEISAGSRKGNLIRSSTLEAFQFLLVRREDGHWYSKQSGGRLKFGQILSAGCVRLVWLGDFLALGSDGDCALEPLLQEKILSPGERFDKMQESTAEGWESGTFRRSPRGTSGLHEETLELELPPEQLPERKESLLLTAGPALTMTVPMLLGCSVTLYAAKTGYGGGGIYLYLGIVTAVSSAGLAFFWSLARKRSMRSICRESAGGCRRRQGIIRPCCISFILLRRSACSTRKTGRSCGTELRMRRISSLSVWVWEAYPFRFIWKFRRQGIGMREIRWCLSCGGRRRNSGI